MTAWRGREQGMCWFVRKNEILIFKKNLKNERRLFKKIPAVPHQIVLGRAVANFGGVPKDARKESECRGEYRVVTALGHRGTRGRLL
jgi:hypothetical protein